MKKAMMKIKKSLTNNVGIKIVAVLIAAIFWLAVVNISDPEITTIIYNVPITMTNEEAITNQGMVYSLESKNYVNLTISGKRSIVGGLSSEDFKADASLSELSKVNAIPIDVSAKNSSIARKITIVKQSMQTVTVAVEDVEKQDFDVTVKFVGKAANGYVAGNYTTSKSIVSVKAPESVLDRIDKVIATCDIDGSSTVVSEKCKLKLYDRRGNEISDKNVQLSSKKVTINVEILKEKEVPIKVNTIGNPANGYQVSSTELSQEKVKIMGTEEMLDNIDQIEINGTISISGQTKDFEKDIDLTKYLPEGVSINGDVALKVTVYIDKLITKTYDVKSSDINIINLKDGAKIKFEDKTIKVSLRGEKEVINKISSKDLSVSVDLEKYDTGKAKVPASLAIPDGVELTKSVYVKVEIK